MKRRKVSAAERKRRSEAAAMLGRAGAVKGGRARIGALSDAERVALASSGGRAFAKLSKRKRRAAVLKGWATRRSREASATA